MAGTLATVLFMVRALCAGDQPRTPEQDANRETQNSVRLDRYGDPLPAGCVNRLGTARLRHTSRIMHTAWSADGRIVASWSYDRVLALWNAQTGQLIRRWSLPAFDTRHRVHCLVFLPAGRSLAVLERQNGAIHLWDFSAGEPPPTPSEERSPPKRFLRFAVSPDGRLLAGATSEFSGSGPGIQIWRLQTGKHFDQLQEYRHLKWEGASASWLGFTAKGDELIAVLGGPGDRESRKVIVWDVATGQKRRSFAAPDMGLTRKSSNSGAAVAPDGTLIAIRTPENVIEVLDLRTGEALHRLVYSRAGLPVFSDIESVAISKDGQRLACGGSDGQVYVWNLQTGERIQALDHGEWVECVAFSPDGKSIASGGRDHVLRLWDIAAGEQVPDLVAHESRITALSVSTDGAQVATASSDGTVYLWDASSGQLLRKTSLDEVWADELAFAPDASYLAMATRDERAIGRPKDWRSVVRVWELQSWKESRRLRGHKASIACLFCTPDSRLLVSGDLNEAFIVGEARTGRPVRGLALERRAALQAAALAPDGKTLAVGLSRRAAEAPHGAIQLLNLQTGNRVREIVLDEGSIDALAFSPDGQTIAAGGHPRFNWWESGDDQEQARAGFPNSLRVWDVSSGALVRKMRIDPALLNGRTRRVLALVFSPDGKRLIAGEESGAIRSFDAETGALECTLSGHSAAVTFLATAAASNVMVSGCRDDLSVLVWDLGALRR